MQRCWTHDEQRFFGSKLNRLVQTQGAGPWVAIRSKARHYHLERSNESNHVVNRSEEVRSRSSEYLEKSMRVVPSPGSDWIGGMGCDIAIVEAGKPITYSELEQRVLWVTSAIRQMALGGNVPVVAIDIPQGIDFIVALLAALDSGCVVVPLDSALPPKRIEKILVDASADLVIACESTLMALATTGTLKRLKTLEELSDPSRNAIIGDTPSKWEGVVLYTSGSTGNPKGVLISGEMLLREARGIITRLQIEKGDRISHLLSPSVIGGLREIFSALVSGAVLFPFRLKEMGLADLVQELEAKQITVCRMVSTLFRSFCHALTPQHRLCFRRLYIGGEPLVGSDIKLFREYFTSDCQLSNVFGATEFGLCTHFVISEDFDCSDSTAIPIGTANEGYLLSVVDPHGNEVEQGMAGNLVVTGKSIAKGYWKGNQGGSSGFDESSPLLGWRVFRTSDVVRLNSSGFLEHLGRSDSQTKISGNRIELFEVESVLRQATDVLDVAVVSLERHGKFELYALVQRQSGSTEDLISFCKEQLVDSAVPRKIIECESLPTTFQGKSDRNAVCRILLEQLERMDASSDNAILQSDSLDGRIAILKRLWRQANRIHADQEIGDSFEFQADSLTTLDFLIQLRNQLNLDLTPQEFKECRLFGKLVQVMDRQTSTPRNHDASHCLRLTEYHPGPGLFLLHTASGEVGVYRHLVEAWKASVTVYGVNVDKDRLVNRLPIDFSMVVNSAIRSIRSVQPQGPYLLAGYSYGGILAYEVACELMRQGSEILFCGIVDSFLPLGARYPKTFSRYLSIATHFPNWLIDGLNHGQLLSSWKRYKTQAKNPMQRIGSPNIPDESHRHFVRAMLRACDEHVLTTNTMDVWFYRSEIRPLLHSHRIEKQWLESTRSNVHLKVLPGNHSILVDRPFVDALADVIGNNVTEMLLRYRK